MGKQEGRLHQARLSGDLCSRWPQYIFLQEHILKPWKPLVEKEEDPLDEEEADDGEPAVVTLSPIEVEKMQTLEREAEFAGRWAALPIAITILLSVFGYLVFKSSACQCGTWCNLGAKEATV